MSLKMTSIRLNVVSPIGAISDKRREALEGVLKEDWLRAAGLPVQQMYMFRHAKSNINLALTPANIQVSEEGPSEVIGNFGSMSEILYKVLDALLLDEQFDGASIEFIGLIKTEKDIEKESLRKVPNGLVDQIPGLQASAFRFILNVEGIIGDFKVEPFLQEPHSIFVSLQLGINPPLNIDELVSKAAKFLSMFKEELQSVAQKIFIDG